MATFEITAPDGKKYHVQGETAEGALAAVKKMTGAAPAGMSPGSAEMTAKSEAAIQQAKQAGAHPNIASFAQGALQNYGDEMIGGIEALKSGFAPGAYTEARDKARQFTDAARAESTPGSTLAGQLTTGIPAALLTGASSIPAVMGTGAAEGAVSAYGDTKGNDAQALKDVGMGAGFGAAGGAAGLAAGKLLQKFMSSGLAVSTIQKAMDGKVGELIMKVRQLGGSPAETDEVLREVLRGQAAKNPTAAAAAVPAAQERMGQVNQQATDDISRLISPENVAAFTKRTQGETRASVGSQYEATKTQPAGPVPPEISNLPGYDQALAAAKELADFEKRAFDPNNLTVEDTDVMQRFLKASKEQAFKGTPVETLKGPIYGRSREAVNEFAKQASPELAAAQRSVAIQKTVDEATDLGKAALSPTKEASEIAEEYAALSPEAQEGYRSAFATRLRAQLAMRGTNANAANVLDKPAVIDKMKALGFPAETIDELVKRGSAARGVLDSLVGGSDTARKQAAAKASQSPLTQVTPQDLMVGALVHPSTLGIMPALRMAGNSQERKSAEMIIKALTAQQPGLLEALMNRSPQAITPPMGLMTGAAASQIGPRR